MTYFLKFCKKYDLILPLPIKNKNTRPHLSTRSKFKQLLSYNPAPTFKNSCHKSIKIRKPIRELCGNVFQIKYNTLTKWFLHLYCIFNINDIKKVIKRTKMLLFKIFNNFWWRWKEFFFVMSREIIQNIIFIFDLP